MTSNMKTNDEKIAAYDTSVIKKKHKLLENKALMLRVAEAGTGIGSSVALGVINKAAPQLADTFYGFARPEVISLGLGIGVFAAAGKKDMVREVGAGLFLAGALPLSQLLGGKIYDLIAG